MNLAIFNDTYIGFRSYERISIACTICGRIEEPTKTKAQQKIVKVGTYLCRDHAVTRRFEEGLSEETKGKLRDGRLGKVQSESAKAKMSESKKALYQTPHGEKLRRALSKKAALQNALKNVESTRRRGIYPSLKNDDYMVYNSSYELRAFVNLETDSNVERYESQIYFEIEGRSRSLDILIYYVGNPIPLAIEVKATRRLGEVRVVDQIADSRLWTSCKGYSFKVWTEIDLGFASPHEATKWADKFISEMTSVDYVAIQAQRNREKAVRYYQTKLKDKKIDVYCLYCQDLHTLREEQYLDNIEKNNKYICHAENAMITGKLPKDHLKKANPYASEGKKKCNGECGEIKSLDSFGDDKSRFDGKSTQCKACRTKKATAKYQESKGDEVRIMGPKPKENPYAVEGKKKCVGECDLVLPYENFLFDKSRRDGYSSRCRDCINKSRKKPRNDAKIN